VDVDTALRVPGVRLVAGCDCYDGRMTDLRDKHGADIFTSRDYREILARDDVDAVIVATPDHWHQRISIEAMEMGKAVYVEKPMVQRIDEGAALMEAQESTGEVLQVGSQGMSSLGNEKAKELFEAGAIGELNYAEGFWARNSPGGAWQYDIPEGASQETVDWDQFLGHAPKRPYDPLRIFRWRNYQDYGTGVSGDLFVHLFSSLHFIVSSKGPQQIAAQGGLRYWKDGRDVPDVLIGVFDYPETPSHPPLQPFPQGQLRGRNLRVQLPPVGGQ
jgi:predicted dehydrogenase